GLKDQLADLGRTGERDLVDIRMRRDRSAGGGTETCYNVDYSVRHARFADQFSDSYGRKRGLFGRLQNQGIAESQSRRDFPTDCGERAVPRNNLSADAN